MRNFTFNTDQQSPKTSFVVSLANPSPATPPAFTLGETVPFNLYLISNPGTGFTYDSRSGNASYTPTIGIGTPGGLPSGGTFTLTFGGQTTSNLSYNISTASLQTALQGLSSIGAGNCAVSGQFPAWDVQFTGTLGLAAQSLITSSAVLLTPPSKIEIGTEQVGDGTHNAIQSIELSLKPAVTITGLTAITQTVASGLPTSGTYTLSFAGQTTSGIAWNATAATIQTALQGLSTIGSSNALVSGFFPNYQVTFVAALALTPEPLIIANAASLSPASAITVVETQRGGGSNNEQQTFSLFATATQNIGWTGSLVFTAQALVELFTTSAGATQPSITTTMEFQYVDGSGNVTVFGSPSVTIYHRVIAP